MAATAGGWDRRLAVNSFSSRNWTLAEDLACYDRLGVERVSLSLPKLEAAGLDRAVAAVGARGLRVDGLLPGCAFDLRRAESWADTRATMFAGIAVAAQLGATTVQTTGGAAGGLSFTEATARLVEALHPVAAAALAAGVRLALEPTRPQFAHIACVHTWRDGLAVAAAHPDLDLWLVVDTAHCWWEPGAAALLRDAAARVAVMQVADLCLRAPVLERRVPGEGDIDLPVLLDAAVDGGFDGPFEIEILGASMEELGYEEAIRRSLTYLTAVLAAGAP
jgi:sugar phosphate isomerase/epimerase